MPDSKRLAVLKALSTHLADRLKGNAPYTVDIHKRVYRGAGYLDDEMSHPVLSIVEDPDADRYPAQAGKSADTGGAVQKDDWQLLVIGRIVKGQSFETELDPGYEFMAQVKMCLSEIKQKFDPASGALINPQALLGGLISDIMLEPGTVRPPAEQQSRYAYFWLRVTLNMVENLNDPYDLGV